METAKSLFDDAFVFFLIERTGRVDEHAPWLECVHGSDEELILELGDSSDVFDMPVAKCFWSLECASLATAWCIEEYSIKHLREMLVVSAVIIGDADICMSHTIEIFVELWESSFVSFIGDDETLWEILR